MSQQFTQLFEFIKPKSTVIIGCSGGADSTFLAHIASEILKRKKVKIVLAHLNHNLRAESGKDADFVVNLGQKLGVKTAVKSVRFKKFNEAEGRKARQQFLEECRKKYQADYILLAHHANDNIETIVMNFVRGSGLTGLQGIKSHNGHIFRPLLSLTKAEILSYLKKHRLPYCHDLTNEDDSYTRNFYRNRIIPLLREKNPNLNQNLQKTAQNLAEIELYLQKKARNWLKNHGRGGAYALKNFRQQDIALQKEILRQLHRRSAGHLQELESKHLDEVLDFLMHSHSGKHKNLGKKTDIAIYGKAFKISKL